MKKSFLLTLATLFCGVLMLNAQVKRVSGTILSEDDGQPLIGATVVIEGTQIGVVTNTAGEFFINNAPANAERVQVSYVGMVTVIVNIQPKMVVKLKSDSQIMEGVVVTGMTTTDRRMFTGASDQLSGDKVLMDGVSDVSRSLEGRSAGVSVQNVSGTFGTAPKIRVRGATSIYGSSRPLWILDGVILEDIVAVSADQLSSGDAVTLISSAVAGLNPDDIDSFQILKDGSATSIYGARAMAGVIVITTKRGTKGTSSFNYTGEFSTRLVPSYSEFNIMNSQEQMDVYRDMDWKGYLDYSSAYRASSSGVYGKMYQLMNTVDPTTGQFYLRNTPESRSLYLKQAELRNTDWFNELFTPSIMQTHSMSISSGTDRARNYTSMSVMNDPGWSQSSSVTRYTLNTNASFDLFKNLSLTLLGNGSYRNQEAPGTTQLEFNEVTGAVSRDFDINPFSYALNSSRTLDANDYYTRNYAPFNIKHELDNNLLEIEVADLKLQSELRWKIIPGLEVSALAAVKYSISNQTHNITEYSNQAMAYRAGYNPEDATIRDRNHWLYDDPDVINSLPETVLPKGGILDKKAFKMLGYDFRATVNYNATFNQRHYVTVFGGAEIAQSDRNISYNRGYGYQFDNGGVPFYDYRIFKKGTESNELYFTSVNSYWRNAAFFISPTYSWDHKYTLTGTLRYEGNNALGRATSARWLPTWNISGAWNAHEEDFFEVLKPVLSYAKVRLSYSLTADRGPGDVSNAQEILYNYTPWRPSASLQEPAIGIKELANSMLTYEKKHELNIGLDLGFLENRINFSTDIYQRDNYDLIGAIETQGVGGQIVKMANIANMSSHGVEFTISTKNIVNKNFNWTTDLTFSWAKNKITDLQGHPKVMELVTATGYPMQGYPVRGLFSFNFQGLNEFGLPTFIGKDGEVTVSNIDFQERDNYTNLVYEGPTDPTITGGFNNTFSYKNFRLNAFVTYSFGNVVRLDPFFDASYSDLSAMPREFINRWMVSGDEKITNIPIIASLRQNQQDRYLDAAYNAYNYSNARIADGGFIRLKEVSLSYDFPKETLTKIGIQKLQLKFQATNLFLLYADSKLNGQDPEFYGTGGVAIPIPKQFTMSVRLGF